MCYMASYKLAKREKGTTKIKVGNAVFGEGLAIIAGPCAVESEKQYLDSAKEAKEAGADALRGGTFKMRTSPYSFQGLGEEGLKILKKAGDELGLPTVTECTDASQTDMIMENADMLQIGARNARNYEMLKQIGKKTAKSKFPVLLKRGDSLTMDEFLNSAEYILKEGNQNVILCLRGIRTFERFMRNTPDIGAIPWLKKETHLPVIFDPSHAAGTTEFIEGLCYAAVAAGADGLLIEMHCDPEKAMCDGQQSVTKVQLKNIIEKAREIKAVLPKGF
jgi:3-deoxy-7-phosphoheptulonate synthase